MRFPIVIFSLLLLVSQSIATNVESKDIDIHLTDSVVAMKYFRNGIFEFDNKRYEKALYYFNLTLKYDSSRSIFFRYKGDAEINLERYHAAIRDYTVAISMNKHDTGAYKGRAEGRRWDNDPEGSLGDYNKALELDPKDFATYYGRGHIFIKMELFEKAISDFDSVILKSPAQRQASYLYRGFAYRNLGKYKDAIKDYTTYIILKGRDYSAYLLRADAYLHAHESMINQYGDYVPDADSAIADAKVSLQFYKDKSLCFKLLGWAYAIKWDSANMRENFGRALAGLPNDDQIYWLWAEGEINFHNYSKALSLLTSYKNISNKEPDFHYLSGIAKAGSRDTIGAINEYKMALELDRPGKPILEARVKLLLSNFRYDSIVTADLEELLQMKFNKKKEAVIHAILATVKFRRGDFRTANSQINEAIRIDPNLPFHYLLRAVISPDDKQKIQDCDKAIRLDETLGGAYIVRSYFELLKGNISRARNYINVAKKLRAGSQDFSQYIYGRKKLDHPVKKLMDELFYPYLKEAIVGVDR